MKLKALRRSLRSKAEPPPKRHRCGHCGHSRAEQFPDAFPSITRTLPGQRVNFVACPECKREWLITEEPDVPMCSAPCVVCRQYGELTLRDKARIDRVNARVAVCDECGRFWEIWRSSESLPEFSKPALPDADVLETLGSGDSDSAEMRVAYSPDDVRRKWRKR